MGIYVLFSETRHHFKFCVCDEFIYPAHTDKCDNTCFHRWAALVKFDLILFSFVLF